MPIEIQAPDGSVVEFPNGTPDATIKAVMAKSYPAPKPESWGGYLTGLGREAVQSATLDLGDELGLTDRDASKRFGAQYPIASTVARIAGGIAPFALGPGAALARAAVAAPRMLGMTGNIARSGALGAGVGGVSGFGAGEGGISDRLEGAGTGAAVGGLLGGALPPALAGVGFAARQAGRLLPSRPNPQGLPPPIQPAGATEDVMASVPSWNPGQRHGGVMFVDERTGPALSAQDRGLQVLMDQVTRANPDAGARLRELATRFTGSDRTPGSLDYNRRFQANSFGQRTESLADVPEFKTLLGSLARKYPEVRNAADEFLNARQSGYAPDARAASLAARGIPTVEEGAAPITGAQAQKQWGVEFPGAKTDVLPTGHLPRVRDYLKRAFEIEDAGYHGHARGGGLRTVEGVVQRAEEQAQTAFADAYTAASGRNLYGAVNDVFKHHIQQAALTQSTGLEADLRKVAGLFLRPTRRTLELEQFNNVKRQLDAMIRDDLSKPKSVPRAGLLEQLRKDLLAAVDNATGGAASPYALARQQFSDSMRMGDAYVAGRRVLGDKTRLRRTGPGNEIMGTEITADRFNALTPGEQKLFRLGMLDALSADAMRKPTEQTALRLFRTPRVRELLGVAIKRSEGGVFEDKVQRFYAMLDSEGRQQLTRHALQGNSATAERLAADAALEGLESIQQVQTLGNMISGSTSAWQALMMTINRSAESLFGVTADQAAEIGRILLSGNRAEQAAVLQRLAQMAPANRMQRFNEVMGRLARHGLGPGAALGGGLAGGSPQQPSFL